MKAGKQNKKAKKVDKSMAPAIHGCIYLLTNLTNGKRYVGQYKNAEKVERRYRCHINTALNTTDTRPLYRAIRKLSKASKGRTTGFSAEVIWRGPREKLHEKEVYYIKKVHSYIANPLGDRSYNLTMGGEGVRGILTSKKSRRKMSESGLARWAKFGEREKQRSVQLLRYEDATERKKHSDGSKRAWATGRYRNAWAAAIRNGTRTPQARENFSKASKARWSRPGEREAKSAEQKKRFADATKKAAHTAAMNTPSAKERASIARKAWWAKRTKEQRAQFKVKMSGVNTGNWSRKTPKERSAVGLKSRDTRRANKAATAACAKDPKK